MNHSTEAEARRLFKFIDYNDSGIISQHQIKLLILYYKNQFPEVATSNSNANFVVKRLQAMTALPNQKVFDADTFSFFFSQGHPDDRVAVMSSTRKKFGANKAQKSRTTVLNEDLASDEDLKKDKQRARVARDARNLIQTTAENRERINVLKAKLDKTVSRIAEMKTISNFSRNAE